MLELASLVVKVTDSASKIIHLPLPQDDPKQRRPDIQLAKEKLSWEPIIDLETGLKRTISYFKNTINL
jgi:UDP-glucuronate decarboxylase